MMNPKFQVGDRVRIRGGLPYRGYGPDGVYCNQQMWAERGKEFEISSSFGTEKHPRYYLVDLSHSFESPWVWEDAFLEPVITAVEVDISSLL